MKRYLPQVLAVFALIFIGLAVATSLWWLVPGLVFGVLSGTVGTSASQDAN